MILPWTQRNDPIARLDIISLCFETQPGQIKGFSFENHWLERWVFQSLSVIFWNYTERNSTKIRRQLMVHLVAINPRECRNQYTLWSRLLSIKLRFFPTSLVCWCGYATAFALQSHSLLSARHLFMLWLSAENCSVSYSNATQFATQKKTIFKSW
jgi:hypothetical protein